jgi:hypothetical protein
MRRSRLLAARSALQVCLDESCAPVLRGDCAGWLKEVETRTPSVVVEVVEGGAPARDARLFVDGTLREAGVDGKAIELDPGTHTFRVEVASGPPVSAEALLHEGEKLKVVHLDVSPATKPGTPTKETVEVRPALPSPTSTEEARRPVPWGVYALGGLGLAAAAGFTTFAILGTAGKANDLEPCKPNCSEGLISSVRQKYIVADVFLGVSVVALLAAGYLYVTRPRSSLAVSVTAGSFARGALAF